MEKVLICDDHELFAESICKKLNEYDYSCLYATTAEECKTLLQSLTFDIFLCDFDLNGINTIELLIEFLPLLKNTKVFILSGYTEIALMEKAKLMGLNGYISKHVSTNELDQILQKSKEHLFVTNIKKSTPQKNNLKIETSTIQSFQITNQEKKIIKLLATGLTSQQIANELFISKNTVDTHKRNIFSKLGLNSSAALVSFAHENNLFS